MYMPKHFEETDVAVIRELIRHRPLGTWVTQTEDGLIANHIPFLLDPDRGEHGTLLAHVARANPVWKSFSPTIPSIVVFQGPQAYISPTFYPTKQQTGKVVPTWNYAVVHAHGIPRVIDDRDWLLDHVSRQTNLRESGNTVPWKVTDAPADFIDSMLKLIVGIEIPIAKIVAKWKVSQNRVEADRLGVVAGLGARGDAESAKLVKDAVK